MGASVFAVSSDAGGVGGGPHRGGRHRGGPSRSQSKPCLRPPPPPAVVLAPPSTISHLRSSTRSRRSLPRLPHLLLLHSLAQPIWSCSPNLIVITEGEAQYCWTIFHSKCIRSWASKSVKETTEFWRARTQDKPGDWRCSRAGARLYTLTGEHADKTERVRLASLPSATPVSMAEMTEDLEKALELILAIPGTRKPDVVVYDHARYVARDAQACSAGACTARSPVPGQDRGSLGARQGARGGVGRASHRYSE